MEKLLRKLVTMKHRLLKCDYNEITTAYIYHLLYKNESISPSDITKKIDISPQAIANLLSSLEKKGIIKRELNIFDKRKVDIRFTEKGREIAKEKYNKEIQKFKELIDYIGEEDSKHLLRILEKTEEYRNEKSKI